MYRRGCRVWAGVIHIQQVMKIICQGGPHPNPTPPDGAWTFRHHRISASDTSAGGGAAQVGIRQQGTQPCTTRSLQKRTGGRYGAPAAAPHARTADP